MIKIHCILLRRINIIIGLFHVELENVIPFQSRLLRILYGFLCLMTLLNIIKRSVTDLDVRRLINCAYYYFETLAQYIVPFDK